MDRRSRERALALLYEAERRRARESLIAYTEATYPTYKAAWHHHEIAAALERIGRTDRGRLLIVEPPRHGKLLADDTPMLTERGWTTHGALRPGDRVLHPSGAFVKVRAVSEPALATMAVETTDGARVLCHPSHEWVVHDRSANAERTVETRAMARVKCWVGGRARFVLPDVSAARHPRAVLPMPPYVLGAWLGDGTAVKPALTHAPEDAAVVERIRDFGYRVSGVHTHKDTGCLTTYFGGPTRGVPGRMCRELQAMGVWGAKHIPDPYKYASIEQRLELVAGLVDTDGHVDPKGRVRIVTSSARLAVDTREVCRSLGWRPYITSAQPTVSSSGIVGKRVVYTVGFNPDCAIPTALPRKRVRRFALRRRVGIRRVEQAPAQVGRCIEVEASDGMYCAGRHLTPTHNSELASRRFPLWWLGCNPGREVVAASYGSRLVKSFGRTMRNLASSAAHRRIFPGTTLSVDSQAQDLWRTADGGSYQAVGVGSGITGFGADLIVIDDPVQGREQADSEVMQEKVWDWYLNDMYTRRQPGCSVVVIGTRWHEADLIGKLLEAQEAGGDQWEILHHPAINDDGEALWPESFPIEELLRTRAQMDMSDPRIFRSLYQGDPLPDEGVYFRREWLRYSDPPPRERMRIYAASDYATKHAEGDWTVHVIVGVDPQDDIHILDLWRARTDSDVWVEQTINLAGAWGPLIRGSRRRGRSSAAWGRSCKSACATAACTSAASSSQAAWTRRSAPAPSRRAGRTARCSCPSGAPTGATTWWRSC